MKVKIPGGEADDNRSGNNPSIANRETTESDVTQDVSKALLFSIECVYQSMNMDRT